MHYCLPLRSAFLLFSTYFTDSTNLVLCWLSCSSPLCCLGMSLDPFWFGPNPTKQKFRVPFKFSRVLGIQLQYALNITLQHELKLRFLCGVFQNHPHRYEKLVSSMLCSCMYVCMYVRTENSFSPYRDSNSHFRISWQCRSSH